MVDKKNFRSYTDAEQQLYRTSKLLLDGKISPSQATAFAKMVDSWTRTKKLESGEELMRRVIGLEALYKAGKKV